MSENWKIWISKTNGTKHFPEFYESLTFNASSGSSGHNTGTIGGVPWDGDISVDDITTSREIHFTAAGKRYHGRIFSDGSQGFAWGRVRRPQGETDDDNTWVATSGPALAESAASSKATKASKTAAPRKYSRKVKG